jgi:hypothetical protein
LTAPTDPTRRGTRSASDIAAELRREFATALSARYSIQARPDPVLVTVFHSLAVQIARVYDEAANILPVRVLDDLIAGLDLPTRLAEPAQAVVCFTDIETRERVSPETELMGYARTGEQLGFTLDETFELSPTELVFAAVYERGRLYSLPGAHLPGKGDALPPANAPLSLGAPPTIFLAFDCDQGHLSDLGLFIDILPQDEPIAQALRRSPWQLLNSSGRVSEAATMRARTSRGGVQRLLWFNETAAKERPDPVSEKVRIGEGPFGSRVWIFPRVPEGRRHRSSPPPAISAVAARLYPPEHQSALSKPFVWIQIPLPAGTSGVANAIQRISVNCSTASNVEIWNEQLPFDRAGSVVTINPEGNTSRHLMGVISVTGESGTAYLEEGDLTSPVGNGRYRVRAGELSCRPGRTAAGRFDAYAMIRLLFCDGERANQLEIGDVRRIVSKLTNVTAQVSNLTVTRGGSSPLAYADARLRFAELLRSRERVVTAADMEIASQAYEPRIREVQVRSSTEIRDGGLELVNTVTVRTPRGDYADPDAELVRLRDSLERHLQERCVIGQRIRVIVDGTR